MDLPCSGELWQYRVRLKDLFLHLPYMVAFAVLFPVAVVDGHC